MRGALLNSVLFTALYVGLVWVGYSDEAGRGYRSEAGRCSDVKPATVPI